MSIMRKVKASFADPVMAGYYAWSRLEPDSLLSVYRARARQAGLDRLYFILSFDCDRDKDIEAARSVYDRLAQMGVQPTFAVPGALLVEGAAVYKGIAADGAEFINHGNRRHMYYDAAAGDYKSSFFYDQESRTDVEDDIIGGDKTVTEVIGVKPLGFRTPHFGTFQTDEQLRFLHDLLRRLDYKFSTSTIPRFGLRYGPVFSKYGLPELPVSGRGSRPFDLLDSWGCFAAPDRTMGPEDYKTEAVKMAERLKDGPGVINFYADPSHIVDQPVFFDAVREIVKRAAPISYRGLMDRLS